MKNMRLAAKKFKRGMTAKPIYDLNKKIFDLIHDLTTSKFPQLRMKSNQPKQLIEKEIFFFRSNFLRAFTFLNGKLICFNFFK